MRYDEFIFHFDFPVTVKDYALVIGDMPTGSVILCKMMSSEANIFFDLTPF